MFRNLINSQSLEDMQVKYISQKYTFFFISATDTEISVKHSFWGPVEWVGDQLTGWGESSQKQNSKKMDFF